MSNNDEINLKIKTAQLSLYIGLFIFVVKVSAYLLTHSSAIFSDAAESVIHILATGMVLYSIILSSRPPDKSHLYGHGNIEFFSAGIEGLLIIIAAITIIYYAVSDIILGAQPSKLDIGTLMIAFSGIVNLALGYYIVKRGKQTKSLALVADGKHILTDSFTSLGVVAGLIVVLFTDIFIIDPIIAILVALNIISTGYKLIRESVGGLMMETDDSLLGKLTEIFQNSRENYHIDVHQLRFWKSADYVFIDFHLTIPFFFNVKQSHKIEEELLAKITSKISNSQIRIHFDFCESHLCKYCQFEPCNERKEDFKSLVIWDSKKLLDNPLENKE